MASRVTALQIPPGIQRDGTKMASPLYTDGAWVRFQRGLPRKMGGYNGIFLNASGISRGMSMTSINGFNYVVSGYSGNLEQWVTFTTQGIGSGPDPYTLSNFTASDNNLWQFDIAFDATGSNVNNLIAHPGQNLNFITSTVNTPVLKGAFPGTTGSLVMSKVGTFTAAGTTATNTAFTLVTANVRIGPGQTITGTGIPAGTTVVSVAGLVVQMSAASASTLPITAVFDNNIAVSGGCVVLHPYLFLYGNNGLIQNSSAGDFSNWVSPDANSNNVASGKILKGLPIRGGSASPAGLFWASDALIRVSFAPSSAGGVNYYWTYDLVSSQTSVMSSNGIIEYDGIFYWAGVDRFLSYNGVVQELDNKVNQNYFFDNINIQQRQKVWATKVPRYGEIWWFYPKGDATECTDAIIYNIREKTWYDAGQAIGARRSAGVFSEIFPKPIWAGNEANTTGKYTLWQHETGVDQVYLTSVNSIKSFFETNNIAPLNGLVGSIAQPGENMLTRIERLEPNFIQTGPMTVIVTGQGYAEDIIVDSTPFTFTPSTLKIDMREQRREMRLRFESNTFNGDYQMGRVLISLSSGDTRSTGNV
tara:strand:- start:1084 stop:2847 length:1764 start_codon:yes stop_codon:yes gene_type:complete